MSRVVSIIIAVVFLWVAIMTMVFTFQKCGWNTFIYGKSATIVALAGMCDK